MRSFYIFIFLLFAALPVFSNNEKDSLINVLKKELKQKKIYDLRKEERIKTYSNQLKTSIELLSPKQIYEINDKLLDEYIPYQRDSAMHTIIFIEVMKQP